MREALRPGGVFVNAEQVAGSRRRPSTRTTFVVTRLAARASGTDDAEWDAAVERMRHDRKVTVEWHIAAFREAGFSDA